VPKIINERCELLKLYDINCSGRFFETLYKVGQKTGLFLRSDNFAMTNDKKACNNQKFQNFVYNEMYNLHDSFPLALMSACQ